ncbi:MAG: hypothetical protein ACQERF_09115 [Actinomycetota bacterium]
MAGSHVVGPRLVVTALVALALVLAGCQPTPSETAGPNAANTLPSVDPASLTWSGSPEDAPDTWAANVDPDSQFGLHKRAGLEPVLRPETHVLTTAEAAAITAVEITNEDECLTDAPEHPMCEFALTFSAVPDDVAPGSVLNAGITSTTPNGLLVKVTAVEGTLVTGVQATLQDALVQGEFWEERVFSADELRGEPVLAPGVTMATRPTGGGGTAVVPTFDASLPGELTLEIEPVDGVKVTGTLDFGAGCGVAGGVGGSDIAWMEISCNAWESASLRVASTKDGPATAERYHVALIPLAGFPIPIGPIVVVVIVDILVTVDLSGNVHVGLDYGGRQRTEVYAGLRFSLGDGLDHTGGVSTTGSTTRNALTQAVSAAATGRAELRLSAYGVLGIGTGGDASVFFSGDPAKDPRWQVRANAGIFIRMFLGMLGYELSAQLRYSLKEPFEIGTWKNSPPVVTVVWPQDGEVVPLGGLVRKVEATALDPEDGALPVTWTDLTTGATASGTGPLDLALGEPGTHALKVRAVDSHGAAKERTITITVQVPGLTIGLRLLRPDGTEMALPPSGRSGSTILVEVDVDSGEILGGVGCGDVDWSAVNATVTPDGSCRPSVRLGQPGTATITARVTDSYGTTASGSASLNVAAAPVTVAPQFRGIDVTTTAGAVAPGTRLLGDTSILLSVEYLNHEAAGVTPRYRWTVSVWGGEPVVLPGSAREFRLSTRSYAPPGVWGHQAEFTVVVEDAETGAELTRRTLLVVWDSLPK